MAFLLSFFRTLVFSITYFKRFLSFDSSIHPNHNVSQSTPSPNLDVTVTVNNTVEIDSASPSAITDDQKDSKRIGELVQPVCLAVGAASIVLFVNLPLPVNPDLRSAGNVFFLCTALFTSLGLSMYSIVKPRKPEVAWIQKRVMVIAISSVLVAFMLWTSIVLPGVFFPLVWLVVLLGAGLVSLICFLLSRLPSRI